MAMDLWPKHEGRGPQFNGKKRGSVTYSTDRENEVSKVFIIKETIKDTLHSIRTENHSVSSNFYSEFWRNKVTLKIEVHFIK